MRTRETQTAISAAERSLAITRRCLEVFLDFCNPVTIITKNHLVTRDTDILRELARLNLVNVAPLIPGLNDPEIPAILEAAASHGGQWANYIIVRLPGEARTIFRDWLERHVPDRANLILNRIRQMRGGHHQLQLNL